MSRVGFAPFQLPPICGGALPAREYRCCMGAGVKHPVTNRTLLFSATSTCLESVDADQTGVAHFTSAKDKLRTVVISTDCCIPHCLLESFWIRLFRVEILILLLGQYCLYFSGLSSVTPRYLGASQCSNSWPQHDIFSLLLASLFFLGVTCVFVGLGWKEFSL